MSENTSVKRGVVRWISKIAVLSIIFALALFLSAGTLGWGMAWLYLGLYVAQQVALVFLLPPDLLAERASTKENTKRWDRLLVGLGALWLPRAFYVVAGLDVATGGAYRYVRHPGYAGGISHHLAVPLLLGSWWALIPGLLGAGVLIVRTFMEDRTLHHELPGYAEYAQQTRYRLLPGVW